MKPFLSVNGVEKPLANLRWSLRDYWLPNRNDGSPWPADPDFLCGAAGEQGGNHSLAGHQPWCATNKVAPGLKVNWARTNRVTYSPVPLSRLANDVADSDRQRHANLQLQEDGTQFAWGFAYVGSQGVPHDVNADPGVTARREAVLASGETLDVQFLIGAGLEEYSAAYAMRVLTKRIDRYGIDGEIDRAAAEARRRTRTTGRPDLDRIMNRNLLFTNYYAWGRTLDSEEFVGVTSRSNQYYVSAAYWDRDALLWSFPALLDTDPARAREALGYALGIQARNIGIDSRFIDGAVLEDGLQLDQLVAPVVALKSYVDATGEQRAGSLRARAFDAIKRRLSVADPVTGLYETFQDAQDEYVRKPFSVYGNVLAWKALNDLAALEKRGRREGGGVDLRARAVALKAGYPEIRRSFWGEGRARVDLRRDGERDGRRFHGCTAGFPAEAPTYLGFIAEDNPLFVRTYEWLHSAHYPFSYRDEPWGLPGSLSTAVYYFLVGRRPSPPEGRAGEGA